VRAECEAAQGLAVQRFPNPEPFRRIGLVRRRSSSGGEWFDQLADVVRDVGEAIVQDSRKVAS